MATANTDDRNLRAINTIGWRCYLKEMMHYRMDNKYTNIAIGTKWLACGGSCALISKGYWTSGFLLIISTMVFPELLMPNHQFAARRYSELCDDIKQIKRGNITRSDIERVHLEELEISKSEPRIWESVKNSTTTHTYTMSEMEKYFMPKL